MIKRLEIDSIINYLQTKTDVTDIVSNRMYWGLPVTEPNEIYVIIQEVMTSTISNGLENRARFEVRIISWNDKSKHSEVQSLNNIILNHIAENTIFWTFEVYKIIPLNWVPLLTADNRKEYIKDYEINFIN